MILLENYAIKATTEAFAKALNVGEGITDDINVMLGKVVIMKTNVMVHTRPAMPWCSSIMNLHILQTIHCRNSMKSLWMFLLLLKMNNLKLIKSAAASIMTPDATVQFLMPSRACCQQECSG